MKNVICFQMAAEIAAPLSQAKKVTMVASGDGEVGAAKLTGEVLTIMAKVPELVKSLTGVDMGKVCLSNAARQPMPVKYTNMNTYLHDTR